MKLTIKATVKEFENKCGIPENIQDKESLEKFMEIYNNKKIPDFITGSKTFEERMTRIKAFAKFSTRIVHQIVFIERSKNI